MKIYYLTTAVEKDLYANKINNKENFQNPSNQNFHLKLIEALATKYKVVVLSLINQSTTRKKSEIGNIEWNYFNKKDNEGIRELVNQKEIGDLLFIDTINLYLLSIGIDISRKYNIKTIGLVTDNPSNISGAPFLYKKLNSYYMKKMSAYICLTEELNTKFNAKRKPNIIVEGIVRENNNYSDNFKFKNYFFFCGAGLEKYGLFNLIEAYKKIENCNKNLIISSHHFNKDAIDEAIKNDNRIIFLGTLPENEILNLEANAYANINPRPINPEIDQYSIPSKVLEYCASKKLVISTKNLKLENVFKNNILWAGNGTVEDLKNAIEKSLEIKTYNKEYMEFECHKISMQEYSFQTIRNKIENLIKKI